MDVFVHCLELRNIFVRLQTLKVLPLSVEKLNNSSLQSFKYFMNHYIAQCYHIMICHSLCIDGQCTNLKTISHLSLFNVYQTCINHTEVQWGPKGFIVSSSALYVDKI